MLPFSHKNNVISQEVIAVSPDERVILFKNIIEVAGLTVEEFYLSHEDSPGDFMISIFAKDSLDDRIFGENSNLTLAEAVAAGQKIDPDYVLSDD